MQKSTTSATSSLGCESQTGGELAHYHAIAGHYATCQCDHRTPPD
jgi:hypothetical protein